MNQARIVLSKLTPPRLKPHVLRRPALTKKIRYALYNSFSLVHAGPGYGKTTSIATYLTDQKLDACWYVMDTKDVQLTVFVRHLVESIRQTHPAFGAALLDALAAVRERPLPDEVEQLAFQYVNELMTLPGELLLVLDNYHLVEQSFFIDQWLQLVVQHLPNNARMMLLTRHYPAWPWLGLMKVRGQCWEIAEKDLSFSEEETEALLHDEYEQSLGSDAIRAIHQRTRGWVLAVQMIGAQLAAGQPLEAVLDPAGETLREISRLLEVELLQPCDDRLRRYLLHTSVLNEVTPALSRHLFPEESDQLFAEAVRRNLLTPAEGEGCRYHPTFRRLLKQWLRREEEAYQEVHRRIALFHRNQGEIERSLELYRRIGDWEEIGSLLVAHGETVMQEGRFNDLYHWLIQIPDAVKDDHYQLWYYQGEVERYRCHYPPALSSYQRYGELAEQRKDVVGQCLALEGQARVHLDSVQGLRAEELLKRAISLLDASYQSLAPRLYRFLAEVYTNRGNASEAERWYQQSKALEQQTEVELESRLYFRTGRLQSALHLLEKKWREERNQRNPHVTRSYRETSLLLAFVYALNGDAEKGLPVADKAIQLGKTGQSPFVEANGYVRKGHIAMLLKGCPAEEVRHLYVKGLHMMEELQSTRGKAEALMGLALLHGREKALDLALAYAQRGLMESKTIKDDWLNGLVRLSMAIAYAHSGQYDQADLVFRQCLDQFRACGDSFGMTICHLWLGFLAYKREDWESFGPVVTEALRSIQAGEYGFLLQRPTLFTLDDVQKLMPILIEAQKRQVVPGYVSQLLTDLGLQNVSFHPGYTLRIQTLGQFRVWLGDKELSEKAWQRGKAKQLFQLLVTKRHHLLAKEEIIHHLWEDSDEESASRDFKVALNALNKALEPNREARASAFFIQRHGSSYGLNLASGYQLDADEFERLVTAGLAESQTEQAIALLEKGLALYQGEYLPECRYEDWCIEERERLQVLYLRGAERLAHLFVKLGDDDSSIRWCETILKTDDCWEEAYRLLMYCYYRKNNRAQSIKWYEKCVAKLKEHLGVQPLPSTQDMFELIMQSEQPSSCPED